MGYLSICNLLYHCQAGWPDWKFRKLNKALPYLTIILLLASCSSDKKSASDEMPPLYSAPQMVAYNTDEGYSINPVTGDSVQPVINSSGDTIKTGVPVPVKGKIIHPDSVGKPVIITAKEPPAIPLRSNVCKIPENLTIIPVDKDKLRTFTPGVDTPSYVLVQPSGDPYPTGIPIPIKGKVMRCIQPRPVNALQPSMIKDARLNIKYLNDTHGLLNDVFSILMDTRGNLWFGSFEGGVSKYNGKTFTHFTEREGLCFNYVSCISEDSYSNLWFGTLGGGVCVYNGETFTQFSQGEGLINTIILCMMVDSYNNIWFGTEGGGAARYDGKTIMYFTTKEGIQDNNVLSMMEDNQGNIWFGTRGGASKFDGEIFTHFGRIEGLRDTINSIHEDREGNIWFGTDRGVNKFDGESLIHFTEKDGFTNIGVYSIFEDSHGNLWFGTQGAGVFIYDGETYTHIGMEDGLSGNHVMSIMEDSQGNMWFTNNTGGVDIYNNVHFTYLSDNEGLGYNYVSSISEDGQGNLWFGTGWSVSKYNGESIAILDTTLGLINDWINSTLVDSQGNLWIGTRNRVVKHDGKSFMHFTEKEGLSNNWVWSILEDSQHNCWFGTKGGGVSRYNGVTFTHYTEKEGLSSNDIRSVAEDSQGNIWFGTYGGGVIKFHQDTITHITEKEGLGSNSVNCILEDSYGNLWFGTEGGGVSIFNGESFAHITEKEGLSNNSIMSILEDNDGNIWISTREGLSYLMVGFNDIFKTFQGLNAFDLKEDTSKAELYKSVIHTYSIQDGLKQKLLTERSMLLDSKNRIWWGNGSAGLIMLDMNSFKIPVEPPKMQLDWIEINEQFADYRQLENSEELDMEFTGVARFYNYPLHLELPYHNNHLTFHFTAIDWSAPHKLRYSYKMDGLNNKWSLPTEEAVADYRNMPSGTFTFVVRAIGDAQKWSDPFEYTFTINPPWWRAWWAMIIDCLLAISLLIAIIRFRERNLKQRAVMLEQQVEEKTHQILEQRKEVDEMKSRFYTNISHEFRTPLTLLISPIEDAMKQGQERTEVSKRILGIMHRNARRLQNLINQLLDISRIESGKMELQLRKANLSEFVRVVGSSFYSLAESKHIQYQIDIEPGVEDSCFDADKTEKIITNLLSNAFKFSEEGGSVSLHLKFVSSVDEDHGQAVIRVADTGKGMEQDQLDKIFDRFYQVSDTDTREVEGSGIGLALTRELVDLMHGNIEVESTPGEGTIFQVTFPVSEGSFSKQEIESMIVGEPVIGKETADETESMLLPEDEAEIHGEEMILVVEDNPDLRSYITEKFSSIYKVIEAENGEIGLQKAIEQIPDLVITDLMMPVMGGVEFCRKLREHPAINHIPVIMLTAKADKDSRIEGLEAAADDYISKPFDQEELQVRVKNLIEQRKRLREKFQKEYFSTDRMEISVTEDDPLLQKLFEHMEENYSDFDFSVEEMGKRLQMSRTQLFRKVNSLTGESPNELLRLYRMKKAAAMIRLGNTNITGIMYEVGFRSTSHFANTFKKFFGQNPSDYRDTIRQE